MALLINIFIETSWLMAHGFHDGMEIVKHKAKILLNCVYFLVKIKSSNHKIFEGCICHHPAPVQTGSIPIIYLDIAKSSGIPFKSWFNNSSIFLDLDLSFILHIWHLKFLHFYPIFRSDRISSVGLEECRIGRVKDWNVWCYG